MLPVLVFLTIIGTVSCTGIEYGSSGTAADSAVPTHMQHKQTVRALPDPSTALVKLQMAESKLFSSNSSMLDVPGGISLLLDVADVLQLHIASAATQSRLQLVALQRDGASSQGAFAGQQQQQFEDDSQGTDIAESAAAVARQDSLDATTSTGMRSSSGGRPQVAGSRSSSRLGSSQLRRFGAAGGRAADRVKRRRARHSRASAVWTPLGRAGFVLAGLSASGLFAEFLPPPPPPASSTIDPAAAAGQQELSWLQTAALAGHVDAQIALADRYRLGRGGVVASCPRSLAWLKQAAKSLAVKAQQEGDIDLVYPVVLLRERWYDASYPAAVVDEQQLSRELEADAAIHADSYSLRRLGYRRLVGRGVAADPAEAFHDFIAAADGGDGYALYNLGYMYLKGIHVARNPSKAITYFRKALDRGVAPSANALGVVHFHGWGVPVSLPAARSWFEQGANMSNAESFYNLATLYAEGLGVAQNASVAVKHYSKAHSLGHWNAAYTLAELYMKDAADGGVGYDCHTASQHLWLFVSERSSWIVASNAALKLYDTPADMRAVPQRQPAAGTQAQRGEDSSDKQKAESQAQSSSNAARTGTDVDAVDSSMTSSEGLSGTGHSAAHSVAHAMPTAAAAGAWWWPRWRGRFLQALLRYLLLAEAGCDACAANAAWMLLRGEGAGGPKALAAAASLLYRSSMLNHTSSMVLLARLLEEATRPHTLAPALAARATAAAAGAEAESAAGAGVGSAAAAVQPSVCSDSGLQQLLLGSEQALLPPVGGTTVPTGRHRKAVPGVLQHIYGCSGMRGMALGSKRSSSSSRGSSNQSSQPGQRLAARSGSGNPLSSSSTAVKGSSRSTSSRPAPPGGTEQTAVSAGGGSSSSNSGSSSGGSSSSSSSGPAASDTSSLLVCRARRAAVAWLHEATHVGDVEAAAELAWLWQRGEVLPADLGKANKLMDRALHRSELTLALPALLLMQLSMWLERSAHKLLGSSAAGSMMQLITAARDAAARQAGYGFEAVLSLPDGIHMPPTAAAGAGAAEPAAVSRIHSEAAEGASSSSSSIHGTGSSRGSSRHTGGKRRSSNGAAGLGASVDLENLLLTVLLGILAGVLWLRRRVYQ